MCLMILLLTMFSIHLTVRNIPLLRIACSKLIITNLVLLGGAASFLFALVATVRPLPRIWLWAALQWTIVTIGTVQLFVPFLKYFPVWLCFMFVVGGVVGGSTTNTNYKVADDYRRSGEPDAVRAFAMSCASFGNFAGDAFGGGLAVIVQRVAEGYLTPRA
jgi:hypothetical protein